MNLYIPIYNTYATVSIISPRGAQSYRGVSSSRGTEPCNPNDHVRFGTGQGTSCFEWWIYVTVRPTLTRWALV